jgi:hypothetical protein
MKKPQGRKRDKVSVIVGPPSSVVAEQLPKPKHFTQEIADIICERLIEGESLAEICRDASMPKRFHVFNWLNEVSSFADEYARARILQADTYADQIKLIAEDGRRDYVQTADGRLVPDHDHISRSRLQVDTLKWIAARMVPKKYGDRVTTSLVGANDGPVEIRNVDELSDSELTAIATAGRPAPAEPEAGED